MFKKMLIWFRDKRTKKWRERIWNPPHHDVIDTNEAVYIDNKRITNVISPDGVKAERQGETATIVTISFIAKSYRKIN